MISIQVVLAEAADVQNLRELHRHEASVQIVRDAVLRRGFAQAYLAWVDGQLAGYGVVGTLHQPQHVLEFYLLPELRMHALPVFRQLLTVSEATHIEAQTNIPLSLLLLYDCAHHITTEALLFEDVFTSRLECSLALFRRAAAVDLPLIFPHTHEPVGEWVIEAEGAIVATGGFLTHYNPPYADMFLEVVESERRRGYGSYLVQALKRVCYAVGKKPAARCHPENLASRRTLEKAGMLPCGRLLVGEVRAEKV